MRRGVRPKRRRVPIRAIVWLVALPILVMLAALGGGTLFGAWFGGLGMTPMWVSQNGMW